jgi:hypothetical protein
MERTDQNHNGSSGTCGLNLMIVVVEGYGRIPLQR